MAILMGRSLNKTHTVWTNDKGETPFSTQSIRAVSCACWCWNIRIREKHCQSWKSAVWFSRHFTADLWSVNLASELQGCIQFFSWLQYVADLLCTSFSSEKFPVPSEWIVDLSSFVFFPAENNMSLTDLQRASLAFIIYVTWYFLEPVISCHSLIQYNQIYSQYQWVAFVCLN